MKFELRHLRYFAAVAEELHFSRAAKRLNIAQPALSRTIANLEEQLGVRLLERSNRKVQLTVAGKVFLEGSQDMLACAEGLAIQTQKASKGEAGELIIGYTDFAINGSLPEILKVFRQHYPQITVEPIHGVTAQQLDKLKAGKIDIGFITGPIDVPDFSQKVVQKDKFVVVFYESHPLADKEHIFLKDLSDESFVLGSTEHWHHFNDHLSRVCRLHGFTPKVIQRAYNSEGIFGLVACEMGITIHLECASNYLRKGLIVRPISDLEYKVQTAALWKHDDRSPARTVFANFIQQQAQIIL
ncbi:MAG: LysR family transcriptional regulator [Arenicella sp.]